MTDAGPVPDCPRRTLGKCGTGHNDSPDIDPDFCAARLAAVVVARHAASYALTQHGLARWGGRDTDAASPATARRLGFEAFCSPLAVR